MKSEKIPTFIIVVSFLLFIFLITSKFACNRLKQANSLEIEITSIIQFEKLEIEKVPQFMERVIDIARGQIKPAGPYDKGEVQWLFTDEDGMIGARLILKGKKEL